MIMDINFILSLYKNIKKADTKSKELSIFVFVELNYKK